MYIQLVGDWDANDNKGVWAYIKHTGEMQEDDEGDLLLFRIEHGNIVVYESQNGFVLADAQGETINKQNISEICQWLTRQNDDVDIEIDIEDLKLYWDWRAKTVKEV